MLFVSESSKLDENICNLFTERISKVTIDNSLITLCDLNEKSKKMDAKKYQRQYDRLVKGLNRIGTDINFINKELKNQRAAKE